MDKNPLKYVPGQPDKSLNDFFSAFKEMPVNAPAGHFEAMLAAHSAKAGMWHAIAQGIIKIGTSAIYHLAAVSLLFTGYLLLENIGTTADKNHAQTFVNSTEIKKKASFVVNEINQSVPITKSDASLVRNLKITPKAVLTSNDNAVPTDMKVNSEYEISYRTLDALTETNNSNNEISLKNEAFAPEKLSESYNDIIIFEPDGLQTLFNTYVENSSFWIAGLGKATGLGSKAGIFNGVKFGWTMNNSLSIGLFANKMETVSKFDIFTENSQQVNGDLGLIYGGVFVEKIFNPEQQLHYFASVSVCGGGYYVNSNGTSSTVRPMAAIEPGLGIEYNLFRNFRIGAEAQYRFVKDINMYDRFPNSNINSILTNNFSLALFFKVGIL